MTVFHILTGYEPYTKGIAGLKGTNNLTNKPGTYCITNTDSGKVYVGSTTNLPKRLSSHISNLKNNRQVNKNLLADFGIDVSVTIDVKPTATIEEAIIEEQRLVNEFKDSGYLCNVAVADVTRPNFGRIFTEEHRQKMSDSARRQAPSETTKQLMSISKIAFYQTPAGKAKLQEHVQRASVKVIVDGVEYPSISAASRALGVAPNTIKSKVAGMPYRLMNQSQTNLKGA